MELRDVQGPFGRTQEPGVELWYHVTPSVICVY